MTDKERIEELEARVEELEVEIKQLERDCDYLSGEADGWEEACDNVNDELNTVIKEHENKLENAHNWEVLFYKLFNDIYSEYSGCARQRKLNYYVNGVEEL